MPLTRAGIGAWTLSNLVTDTNKRMLVVKYLSDGTIDWQKAVQVEAGLDCRGADADIDSEGNVSVCGSFDYEKLDRRYFKFNDTSVYVKY